MKKYISLLCIALLCAAALALTACGGGSAAPAANSAADASAAASAEASASDEANTSAATEAASSAAGAADGSSKFTGDWKLAGLDYMGLTVTGNYSALVDWADGSMNIADDGTGTVTLGEESGSFTWEQDGDNKLAVKITGGTESIDNATSLILDGDVLTLEMSDEEATGGMKFTRDGTMSGSPDAALANTSKITKEDALIGTWTLAGMTQNGAVIYGDPEALTQASQLGDSTLELKAGGKGSFGAEEAAWEIGADGATIKDNVGTAISAKAAGEYLVLDIGEPFDMDMTLFYRKAS